ncbi:MAG TPA: response regulator transcription factor [Anaerolineaceae bacterium]|nr:response regulator transcription factor [Anaerolineaceae bacterium]
MIRILIADDHAIVRRGVRDILFELPFPIEVYEASSALSAIREITNRSFDILILDISFPDGNGLDVLNQVKSVQPNAKVLFLSMYPEEQYARRAIKNGAFGYLTKDSAPTELVAAIKKVIAGHKYVTSTLAQILLDDLVSPDSQAPHETLSDREFQVMLELAKGKKTSEIAAELLISPKTVSTYRARVYEKLNISTTAELVRYVMDRNLG